MLAGNQALPLFLRVEVWLLSKVVRKGSELEISLHFLLTHSRRLVTLSHLNDGYDDSVSMQTLPLPFPGVSLLVLVRDRRYSHVGSSGVGETNKADVVILQGHWSHRVYRL